MKITVFFCENQFASWNVARGIPNTLERMGHDVTAVVTPPQPQSDSIHISIADRLKREFPSMEFLKQQDLILISGPEHIACWIDLVYTAYSWKHSLTVPKAAWFHESSSRQDGSEVRFEEVFWSADHFFVPAIQDEDFYNQEQYAKERIHWLPFGVDTEVFKPTPVEPKYDLAFIGAVYGYRGAYLARLAQYEYPKLHIADVCVKDVDGFKALETAARLAAGYCACKVLFVLPTLSRLATTKVYESLACGTFVLAPLLGKEASANNKPLIDAGIVCYTPANMAETSRRLQHWSKEENSLERERIAAATSKWAREECSLVKRLETILSKVGVKQLVS